MSPSAWSSTYSVQSVLLQLQSFFFPEHDNKSHYSPGVRNPTPRAIADAKREASVFRCEGCGFEGFASREYEERVRLAAGTPAKFWGQRAFARASKNAPPRALDKAEARSAEAPAKGKAHAGAAASLLSAGSDAISFGPVEGHGRLTRGPLSPHNTAAVNGFAVIAGPVPSQPVESAKLPVEAGRSQADCAPLQASRTDLPTPLKARVGARAGNSDNPDNPGNPQTAPDRLSALPTDVLVQIIDRLDAPALSAFMPASKHFARASTERGSWVRLSLHCFHTKRGFSEEALGFGLGREDWRVTDPDCVTSNRFEDDTCRVCGPLLRRERGPCGGALSAECLSRSAFFEGKVRRGVWGENLEWWLPLLLDGQHCTRALPQLKGTISALVAKPWRPLQSTSAILEQSFDPLDTLKVLPTLMNGIPALMAQLSFRSYYWEEERSATVNLHVLEKALLGYCQLHHMLLWLAQEYPVIQAAIDRAVSRFHTDASARHKDETPDLGELLVLLSATTSDVTWDSIAPAFMAETLDRDVLSLLSYSPELRTLGTSENETDYRLATTFDESIFLSQRLLMFQVAFLLLVRPSGSSVHDTLGGYSQRYGYPQLGLARKLQQKWHQVLKVDTWPSYYSQLGLECPPKRALCEMLRQAIVSSRQKGYHSMEEGRIDSNQDRINYRFRIWNQNRDRSRNRALTKTWDLNWDLNWAFRWVPSEDSDSSGEDDQTENRALTGNQAPTTNTVLTGPQGPANGRTPGTGPVLTASGGDAAPSTSARGSDRALTRRNQRGTARQVAVISQNPFLVLADDDEHK